MITSTTNNTIKMLIKLKQKKYRDELGYYLIEEMCIRDSYCNMVIR